MKTSDETATGRFRYGIAAGSAERHGERWLAPGSDTSEYPYGSVLRIILLLLLLHGRDSRAGDRNGGLFTRS